MIKTIRSLKLGNRLFHATLCSLAVAALTWSPPAWGVNANINIINFAFTPNLVTINANDSIT